jgi:PPM family protein phosphatase
MRIQGWGASDVGRRREHNEDSFLCNDALALYAVADGMGGHLGGERASRMAVEILERYFARESRPPAAESTATGDRTPQAQPSAESASLRGAVGEADRAIYDSALADPAYMGMGTTLTAILLRNRQAHVAHVGDSRAYLYRPGELRQLTEDHSWIQDQVRAGLMSEAEAKESRFRNIITRSVGFEPAVRPDMQELTIEAGDCFPPMTSRRSSRPPPITRSPRR